MAPASSVRTPTSTPALSSYLHDPSYSVQLQVLQNPDRGRKFASKDKRPLDPPPIVQLRIFRDTQDADTGQLVRQEVTEYSPHLTQGFVCHVDLLKAAPEETLTTEVSSAYPEQSTWLGGSEEFSHTNYPVQVDGDGSYTVSAGNPSLMDGDPSKMLHGDQVSYHHQGIVIHLPDGHQLTSPSVSSQQTHLRSPPGEPMRNALFGTLEVQAKSVDLYGAPALLFVFGDIAVRHEGMFLLQYICFDVFARTPNTNESRVLAQAYSTKFRVYATKAFPGLLASTDLTKIVLAHGIYVRIRQEPRKRRRKVKATESGQEDGEEEEEEEEEDDSDEQDEEP